MKGLRRCEDPGRGAPTVGKCVSMLANDAKVNSIKLSWRLDIGCWQRALWVQSRAKSLAEHALSRDSLVPPLSIAAVELSTSDSGLPEPLAIIGDPPSPEQLAKLGKEEGLEVGVSVSRNG